MKSSDQIRRLLNLVPYLQRSGVADIADVATDFGVTANQVLRDLEVLQFCGLPDGYFDDLFHVDLEGAREDGVVSLSNADVLRRPRTLRGDEATSLLVALELITETSGGSAEARSALEKLRRALPNVSPAVEVEVIAGDPALRRALRLAVERRSVVAIDHAGRSGVRTHVVEPARLRTVDGYAYLDAWSRNREGWRSFRLDRISGVRPTGETYRVREGLADASRDWFDGGRQLTLTLDPRAAWVAEYHPASAVEWGDGELRVTFRITSVEWAAGLVLQLGELVRSVSDPDVAGAAAKAAQAALLHYG